MSYILSLHVLSLEDARLEWSIMFGNWPSFWCMIPRHAPSGRRQTLIGWSFKFRAKTHWSTNESLPSTTRGGAWNHALYSRSKNVVLYSIGCAWAYEAIIYMTMHGRCFFKTERDSWPEDRGWSLLICQDYTGIFPFKSLKFMWPYNKTVMEGYWDISGLVTYVGSPTRHAYIPVSFHNYILFYCNMCNKLLQPRNTEYYHKYANHYIVFYAVNIDYGILL